MQNIYRIKSKKYFVLNISSESTVFTIACTVHYGSSRKANFQKVRNLNPPTTLPYEERITRRSELRIFLNECFVLLKRALRRLYSKLDFRTKLRFLQKQMSVSPSALNPVLTYNKVYCSTSVTNAIQYNTVLRKLPIPLVLQPQHR